MAEQAQQTRQLPGGVAQPENNAQLSKFNYSIFDPGEILQRRIVLRCPCMAALLMLQAIFTAWLG